MGWGFVVNCFCSKESQILSSTQGPCIHTWGCRFPQGLNFRWVQQSTRLVERYSEPPPLTLHLFFSALFYLVRQEKPDRHQRALCAFCVLGKITLSINVSFNSQPLAGAKKKSTQLFPTLHCYRNILHGPTSIWTFKSHLRLI